MRTSPRCRRGALLRLSIRPFRPTTPKSPASAILGTKRLAAERRPEAPRINLGGKTEHHIVDVVAPDGMRARGGGPRREGGPDHVVVFFPRPDRRAGRPGTGIRGRVSRQRVRLCTDPWRLINPAFR
jgi:hypothetical protein